MRRRPMSLRGRLALGLVGLAAVGLVCSGVATYLALETFLIQRVDRTLVFSSQAARQIIESTTGVDLRPGQHATIPAARLDTALQSVLPPQGALQVQQSNQPSLVVIPPGATPIPSPATTDRLVGTPTQSPSPSAPPALAAGKAAANSASSARHLPGLVLVTKSLPGGQYRVAVSRLPGAHGVLVVSVPLADQSATLNRLVLIEVIVGSAVLAALGVLARWVVRQGLRPLDEIADTAAAIAKGDRTRRMGVDGMASEVSRVAGALNHMLEENEVALSARVASEVRLRQFVADASHELRTPLTSIRGYTELVRNGAASTGESRELALRRIEDESVRMSRLVDDLLLLARLDEGRIPVWQPVDLGALTVDAAHDLLAVDPDRPIAVDVPAPVPVSGDPDQLRQVLANLVGNVHAHTAPGTPARLAAHTADGWAELLVADEGPGLADDQAEHVFDRFYRADPARRHPMDGTVGAGLGLSIVAAVVAAHGGTVETRATSPGLAFVIRLPAAASSPPIHSAVPAHSQPAGRC